jgi:SAM-dependent methyltransferase
VDARDAEELLAAAVPPRAGLWADLGAGRGTFSRALARLIGMGSRIYAVDRDRGALKSFARSVDGVELIHVSADFTEPLSLPGIDKGMLDGVLFANSLHYVAEPGDVLAQIADWVRPGGLLVVVEYDGRRANRWVPYPIPVADLPTILAGAGFSLPIVTAMRPSAYGGTIYVAAAQRRPRD